MREPTSSPATNATSGGCLHPDLIRIARTSYQTYLNDCERTGSAARPIGVAVNRVTHRANVIIQTHQPLLPQEYLVPLHLIDPNDLRRRDTRR